MKNRFRLGIILIVVLAVLGAGSASAQGEYEDYMPEFDTEDARGVVLAVSEYEEIEDDWFFVGRQMLTVEILTGKFKGHIEEIENTFTGNPYRDLEVRPGDQVILLLEVDQGRLLNVHLNGLARDRHLYIMVAVFIFTVVIIARFKGIKALVTLVLMGFVILRWLLPLILEGYNPLLLTVLFTSLITGVTLAIVGGINAKTAAAILGTIGGVGAAGLLAWIFGNLTRITGISEEAQMLFFADLPVDLDVRGLLFSGIIIGALGAVMDVAMSIASAIAEVKQANPRLAFSGLFTAGFNVGRDVLGTMVNTLILAYAGGALPLLLLFMAHNIDYMNIINLDLVATEVVRSIAGSFGLLITVPLTAVLAALLMSRARKKATT
ncbi:MAG: YibE/F family protein [Firmicutes bacterium]|nr:YibE/F family protein [Bacillota bacterium]HPZ91148.1 YibE/F family protein [Bacillota bacterium]HQE01995.1 YibE/F family protein [Bacillota bacterium]